MARITTCSPCQMGDHKHHYQTVQAVPEGMFGGAICACEGECKDGRYKPNDPALQMLGEAFKKRAEILNTRIGSDGPAAQASAKIRAQTATQRELISESYPTSQRKAWLLAEPPRWKVLAHRRWRRGEPG